MLQVLGGFVDMGVGFHADRRTRPRPFTIDSLGAFLGLHLFQFYFLFLDSFTLLSLEQRGGDVNMQFTQLIKRANSPLLNQ